VSHPKVYRVDYGEWAFEYDLSTPGELSYTSLTEALAGVKETVAASVVPVAPEVFVVSFKDAYATVVAVQDFGRRVVNTWMTMAADNSLTHLQGKLVFD
jgi:hypothetical protein